MKTIFIYDQLDADIQFFVKEGNYSHLDKLYLNCYTNDVKLDEELSDMLYDDNGLILVELLDDFPILEEAFVVVRVGFIP